MKSTLAGVLLLAMLSVLAGCSAGLDRKVDGKSENAFEKSLADIRESAKPEDVAALDDALRVLAITDVSIGYEGGILGAMKKIAPRSPEQLADVLMPIVDGKTGREIIAAGQRRKKDAAQRQLAAAAKELEALKKLAAEKAETGALLKPIEILEPTLRFSSVGPEKMSVMDFKVRNGSETGITYLYLRGSVAEAGTRKVLFADDIKYKLSDEPLLPGVVKALRLPHGGRGKWNAPEIWGKDNLVFTIEVVNAEDLSGKKLAAAFTHRDAERLKQLEQDTVALNAILAAK